MIHQRGELHQRLVLQEAEALETVGCRHLAAQVDVVVRAQATRLLCSMDGIAQRAHFLAGHFGVLIKAHPQSIKDCGDAGRGNLRVVRLHCSHRVPTDARTRSVMALEVIGVKLDESGQKVVAVEVGPFGGCVFRDFLDLPIEDDDGAAYGPVGQDDARVGEDLLVGHHVTSSCETLAGGREAMNGMGDERCLFDRLDRQNQLRDLDRVRCCSEMRAQCLFDLLGIRRGH